MSSQPTQANDATSVPRPVKTYAFNNLAGCVTQKRSRETGDLCGLYHGQQSGMECDTATPWVTVCELHSTLVCHETLAHARTHLPSPTSWCEPCQLMVSQKKRAYRVALGSKTEKHLRAASALMSRYLDACLDEGQPDLRGPTDARRQLIASLDQYADWLQVGCE